MVHQEAPLWILLLMGQCYRQPIPFVVVIPVGRYYQGVLQKFACWLRHLICWLKLLALKIWPYSYQSIIRHQAQRGITCRSWRRCSIDVWITIILVEITICVIHVANSRPSKARLAAFTSILISDSGVSVSIPAQADGVHTYIHKRCFCKSGLLAKIASSWGMCICIRKIWDW